MVTEKTLHKLKVLGGQSFDDREGPPRPGISRKFAGSDIPGIFPILLPRGRVMPLLSTMMTNACSYDCRYCPMRASRDMPRYAFSPEELAGAFMALRRARRAKGLFLTSGVPGSGAAGVDRMIAAAEILRKRHAFKGYIHLKMLPRAKDAQLDRAAQLATRLSVNLEAATESGLAAIAPEKDLGGGPPPRPPADRGDRPPRAGGAPPRGAPARGGDDPVHRGGKRGERRPASPGLPRPPEGRPPPPRPLQRLRPGAGDRDGGGARRAASARAPPLPGRAPPPGVRLLPGGDPAGRGGPPRPRDGPQAGLGPVPPRILPGRDHPGRLRRTAPGAGGGAGLGAAARRGERFRKFSQFSRHPAPRPPSPLRRRLARAPRKTARAKGRGGGAAAPPALFQEKAGSGSRKAEPAPLRFPLTKGDLYYFFGGGSQKEVFRRPSFSSNFHRSA